MPSLSWMILASADHPLANPGATSQLPALIILPLLLGAAIIPAMGLWHKRLAHPTTVGVLLVFAFFSVKGLVTVLQDGPLYYSMAGWVAPIGIQLVLDALSAFIVVVVSMISVLVSIYAGEAVRRETADREVPFYATMVIMLLGLVGMALTGDLFNLYVFFEVSSLAGYALMSIGNDKAPVSAFRYLIMGTLGASFYLIGVGYIYLLTGSLNMIDVAPRLTVLTHNPALHVAVIFMVTGLGLKMAMFPLHGWLPDAYTYASSTSTAIIAPVMTKISAYVLIRVLYFVYPFGLIFSQMRVGPIIAWLSMIGVIVGSTMAIAQKDPKRMLAFSSVAQVGYIGVGIGLGNPLALIGAILHILNHAIMKAALFMVVGNVSMQAGIINLRGYKGLGRKMPWTFAAFTLTALAMIGIPPTNGFWSKWYLIWGSIDAGQWGIVGLVIASGVLTAVYFFRVIEKIYTAQPDTELPATVKDPSWRLLAPLVVLAVGTLLLGLVNAWIVRDVLSGAVPGDVEFPAAASRLFGRGVG